MVAAAETSEVKSVTSAEEVVESMMKTVGSWVSGVAGAEEEKKEEEPIPMKEPEPAEPLAAEPVPQPVEEEVKPEEKDEVKEEKEDKEEVDKETKKEETEEAPVEAAPEVKKKRGGLKAYLASLASRNKAKKEYLAKLKASNEAKKKLLKKKGGKEVDEASAQDETVGTDAAVASTPAASSPSEKNEGEISEQEKKTGDGSLAFVDEKKDPEPVKLETVDSNDTSSEEATKEPEKTEEKKPEEKEKADNAVGTIEVRDSAELAKTEECAPKEGPVSEEDFAKVEQAAQSHATWTCCAGW